MYTKKQKCSFSDSPKLERPFIQLINLEDSTVVKCTMCSLIFFDSEWWEDSVNIISKQRSTRMHCLLNLNRDIWQTIFVNWSRQKPNEPWPIREIFDCVIDLLSSEYEVLTVIPDKHFYECTYLRAHLPQKESE
jgi:hypothetical protein